MHTLLRGGLTIALAGACTSSHHRVLEPPDALTPVAGACSTATGRIGNVSIGPDLVPVPRCVVIRHDQRLSVTNRTDRSFGLKLGTHLEGTVAPGQTHVFPVTVGTYLAPGVHRLVFTPASAADIWVDARCQGPEGLDCVTP